jgi:hypothetical protein
MTKMLKLLYFGHLMRAYQFLEKDIMLGITAGVRKKRVTPYAVDGRHQKHNCTFSK